jgi:hypothetical protein
LHIQALVHFQIPVLITIALIIIIIPCGTILITTNNYFETTNFAYSQTDQTIFNNVNPLNVQSIPIKKVHVGDIDIAYKMFGKGEPILLISGVGGDMNSWDPSTLKGLSSNHT